MESVDRSGVNAEEGGDNGGVAPLTNSILSQAVLDAIGHTDAKLAFDMMLVNEHLTSQDAANRSLKEEVAFLKQTLAKQTLEQSEMFHYFHDKTDEHLAHIAELEKDLSDSQAEYDNVVVAAQVRLEIEQRERAAEQTKAQEEAAALKEELRQVHAFAVAKRELEAHTHALETQLDAQRAAFQTQMQDLERNNLVEQARTKQELLARMQAAKAELMLRTNDQVASTTQRTLLENEHFTQELAFQSRETERLLEKLDAAQKETAALRAKNAVLEANEQLMAKKNRYYQKLLAKLQHPKFAEATTMLQLELSSPGDAGLKDAMADDNTDAPLLEALEAEKQKRIELEAQVQRAIEWLRVFQRERQFILAQQDEVIQFLYRSLDEAAEAQRLRKRDGRTESALHLHADLEVNPACAVEVNKRVEDLIQQAPSTTTMEAFGRRVLAQRPALDELSSSDVHEVLLFLLEKLHLYQVRISAIYPTVSNATSPIKQMLERQLGVELPPISNSSTSPSSNKQKRRVFAHVVAAVDAGSMEWLGSPKAKVAPAPHSTPAPLSPQLLAMATNQFNFISSSPKQSSPTKRRYQQLHHSSLGRNPAASPPRKVQTQIQPLIPWSKDEVLGPWQGTASTASIPEWNPNSEANQ
ncbi:hypothetical protein PF005_g22982 [Phytophthora fragariae]|uniref:Cilia- and flagella-associated protein 157 n=1 Tax=Phytophthora fragariae TaxID=53985 RepID=A0A6A3RSN1_9STRA|nr:hypothetical protein PF003_g29958 [Phytophthora fragariae]KAE8926048.1 hypothetical protein PF009_g23757 [Phytophthora fragariae]KAE8982120.1 hypothetical protein PF011_g21748 [Phytophthora fragariae]KAE9080247.1 hypothetical protein PF010_g22450 [Phytophthora fragariae]KAE9080490.1 hypothetical protein PF007_g23033 [Phytophthora fragariae]